MSSQNAEHTVQYMTYHLLFDHLKSNVWTSWDYHGEQTESTPSAYEHMHVLTVSLSNSNLYALQGHGYIDIWELFQKRDVARLVGWTSAIMSLPTVSLSHCYTTQCWHLIRPHPTTHPPIMSLKFLFSLLHTNKTCWCHMQIKCEIKMQLSCGRCYVIWSFSESQ